MQARVRAVLSAFYLTHFAVIGILVPYFGLYARSLGFTPTRIGILLALIPLAKAALPGVWGAAADRTGSRRLLLVVSTWLAAAAWAHFFVVESFAGSFAVMSAYAALAVPALPFVEATTLESIETTGADYGRIRVFGSLGFALAAIGFGWLARDLPASTIVPACLFLMVINAMVSSLIRPAVQKPSGKPLRTLHALRTGPVFLILAAGFLMQASHGAYIGFLSLVLEDEGYSTSAIGLSWAGSIAAEVIILLVAGRLMTALGRRRLLALSVSIAVVRWALYSETLTPVALVVGQAMHGFTYAGFHVAAIKTVHGLFPAGTRSTGQALYSGLTYGAGLMVGTSLSGIVDEHFGAPTMFRLAAGLAAGALLLVLMGAGRSSSGATEGTAPVRSVAPGR